MNLRIIHKGIALALIPLAVNVVWIGLLASSLSHARELLQREHRQTVVLTHINKVTILSIRSFAQLVSFASSGSEYLRLDAEEAGAKVKKELSVISKLTSGDPSVSEWVEKYSATIDEDIRMLRTLNGEENAKLEIPARVKKMRGLIRQAGIKNETLMNVMRESQTRLDALREEELEAQEYVRTIVVLGLVSNFTIAMILILLVVKDVKGRLQVLLNNAHLLPKSIPLTERVSGRDELSELDEELHAASAQLIEAADYRRSLMQMMAHDLRSPLSACMVSLEMLIASDLEFGPREKKYVKSIDRSLKTSIELISDLLLLESLEVGNLALEREPENLNELIDTAALTVGSLASFKQIDIKNDTLKEYVTVDRNRILQVITNLLSNAIKFSPVGSTIRVLALNEDYGVKVSIVDQGCGLSAQESSNLFQKFHQTAEGKKAGGTGLGLAISKLIVESHGGRIGVDSEPGKGAEFWFVIPHIRDGSGGKGLAGEEELAIDCEPEDENELA